MLSAGLAASPWFSSWYLLISRSSHGFPVRNASYLCYYVVRPMIHFVAVCLSISCLFAAAYGIPVGFVLMMVVVGNWSLLIAFWW